MARYVLARTLAAAAHGMAVVGPSMVGGAVDLEAGIGCGCFEKEREDAGQ
jgi:hypothetical protein